MKHNIRINGKVQELDCELGSGILDKNGREIFEGNLVKTPDDEIVRVKFENGVIGLATYEPQNACAFLDNGRPRRNPFLAPLYIFRGNLEIID